MWLHDIESSAQIKEDPLLEKSLSISPYSQETKVSPPWLQACLTSAKYRRGISCNESWSEFAIASLTFAIYPLWENFQCAPRLKRL